LAFEIWQLQFARETVRLVPELPIARKSKIENRKSKIENRKSKIENPKS